LLTFIRLVLDRRLAVIGILAALTCLSIASTTNGVLGSSMAKMFLGENPNYQSYLERTAVFGSHETLLVSYPDPDLLSIESLDRLDGLVAELAEIEDVDQVTSLLDATRFARTEGSVHIARYADLARESPALAADLQAELAVDPSAGGMLVSRDGKNGLVTIVLEAGVDRPAERGPQFVVEVLQAFEAHGYDPASLRKAGLLAALSEMMVQTEYNITRLFPLVVIAVALTVWLLFRRLVPMAIALGISGLAVVWTLGFAIFLDPEVSIFMGLVPPVVMIVAVSDSVHLWSAYVLELSQGRSKREAIEISGSEVGRACVLTSVTTLFGFLSICLVPAPAYKQLGMTLGFGSSVALLITVTLMPVLLSWVRTPEIRPQGASPMDGVLASISRTGTDHPWRVIGTFGAATVLLAFGASLVTIDADIVNRMSEDNVLRRDTAFFEDNYAGANWMEIYVDTPVEGGAFEPEVLQAIYTYETSLDQDPEVDGVISLATVIADLNEALTGTVGVPEDPDAVSQLLFLLEMGDPAILENLVDPDHQTLRVMARLDITRLRGTHDAVVRAQKLADTVLPAPLKAEALSLTGLYGSFMEVMVQGQRNGVLFASATICFLMMIGLRSIRVGLWSMLPNLLPVLSVIGVLGLTQDLVDSDTMIIMMMAIGIGVDDTIHFLMRFRLESSRRDTRDAIHATMAYAGRGIVLTSVILVIGFAPLALSDYFSIWIMGTYLPMALLVALAADLYLVPALATVGLLRYR
jgi:predicted RND superfamily exporter protein